MTFEEKIQKQAEAISALEEQNKQRMDARVKDAYRLRLPGHLKRQLGLDKVHDFVGNFAPARKNDLWGVIDTTGRVVVPFTHHYIFPLKKREPLIATARKGREIYKIDLSQFV